MFNNIAQLAEGLRTGRARTLSVVTAIQIFIISGHQIKVMLSARYEDKGRSGGTAPHNLSSALDESEWSASRFTPKEKAPETPE